VAGEDEDYGSASVRIVLDDADAVADARDLGLRIRRALDRATRDIGERIQDNIQRGLRDVSVAVQVTPDMSQLRDRIERAAFAATAGTELRVPVVPDLDDFVTRIRALLAGEEFEVRVIPDLTDFDARIRAHSAPTVTVDVDFDTDALTRALGNMGAVAGRVGGAILGALRIGALGIAAAGAASGIAQLTAALAPAAGLLAALPAVVLGFQAALGALRLALSGVGDAFKAALTEDAEAFEESLEGLSPKAQAAAREVRALRPAFEELKESVQDGFFAQIEGEITRTANALAGPLKTGLTGISTAWGVAARNALGYVQGSQGVSNVQSVMRAAQAATEGFSQTTNRLTAGLLQLAAVVSDRFGGELAGGIENLGQRFGTWLQQIAQGGQAVAWVDGAITTLAQLGDIAGNVQDIFAGMFRAGNDAGAGVLTNLQQITQAVSDFVNSTQGQDALGNIFGTIGQVAAQLGPIISALLTNLGGIAPALAPIFQQLGPVIVQTINQLGAAAQGALPQLAVVFQQLGLAALSLGPALPPVAEAAAALARSFADLVVALAPAAALLAQLLAPIVNYAAPVLAAAAATLLLVKAVRAAQAILLVLQGAWLALNAAFVASPIGVIVVAVIGLVTAIYLLYQRFDAVRGVVDAAGRALRDGFLAAVGFVRTAAGQIADFFVGAFQSAQSAISTGVDAVVGFFTSLPGRITSGLSSLGSTIGQFFVGAFEVARAGLATATQAVVDFFLALPGRILAALAALPGLLLNAFTSAVAYVIIGLLTVVAGIVFVFTELPGRIYNALLGLGALLISAFLAGTNAVTSTVSGWISATVGWFRALPGRIAGALSSLGSALLRNFISAFNSARSAVSGWISSTVGFFRTLPGRIAGALASLGSALLRNFTSAFNSARGRITSFISTTVGFFRGLPGRVASALAALPGRIAGVFTSAASRARSAVSGLISGVVSLFRGLPGAILNAIGNIGGQIMAKVKSGIPSSVRKYLPFAKGGIVYGPTHALIGEAGPEVVIPLTNPKRAAQLAQQSGLLGILASQTRTLAATATAATTSSGASVGGAVSTLRTLLAGIGQLLDGVGANVVQGMVDGIRDNADMVATAAGEMADTAAVAARDTLEIHSPSRVFAKIGRDVGRGFIQGLTGTASQIKATTEKLVKDIQNAFAGKKTRLDDQLVAMLDAGNKRLQKLAAERDALAKRIADARKFAADTTAQALQAFSLQNLTQGQSRITARTLTAGLESAVERVRTFTAQINRLARRGLRKDLLQQIVGLGPEQGAELAAALNSATSDQLKRINSLQGQLAKASGTLGTSSADILFDAGKQAGRGFLTGLQAQRKSIERLMLDIAKGMQAAIRSALDINSPSRVMRRLGDYTGLGLQLGLVDRIAGIMRTSTAAARAVVDAVSSQFDLLPGRVSSSLAGVGDLGADVVPLTRAQRVRQAGAGGGTATGGGRTVIQNNHFEIREVGNGQVTAHRVVARLVHAAGVTG
jgi:phage-related protein